MSRRALCALATKSTCADRRRAPRRSRRRTRRPRRRRHVVASPPRPCARQRAARAAPSLARRASASTPRVAHFLSRRRNRRRVSFTNSLPSARHAANAAASTSRTMSIVASCARSASARSRLVFRRDRLRLDATPLRRRRHTRVPHRRSVIILARTNPVAPSVGATGGDGNGTHTGGTNGGGGVGGGRGGARGALGYSATIRTRATRVSSNHPPRSERARGGGPRSAPRPRGAVGRTPTWASRVGGGQARRPRVEGGCCFRGGGRTAAAARRTARTARTNRVSRVRVRRVRLHRGSRLRLRLANLRLKRLYSSFEVSDDFPQSSRRFSTVPRYAQCDQRARRRRVTREAR